MMTSFKKDQLLVAAIAGLLAIVVPTALQAEETSLKKSDDSKRTIVVQRADSSIVKITRLDTHTPVGVVDLEPVREDSYSGLDLEESYSPEEIDGGLLHLDIWSSDTAEANMAIQFGGDYFNTFLAAGIDTTLPENDGQRNYQFGFGFGTRIPVWRVFFDLDFSLYGRLDEDFEFKKMALGKARLGMGYRFATHFAIFAGASANLMADADLGFIGMDTTENSPTYFNTHNVDVEGPLRLTAWPGFYAGFEL